MIDTLLSVGSGQGAREWLMTFKSIKTKKIFIYLSVCLWIKKSLMLSNMEKTSHGRH